MQSVSSSRTGKSAATASGATWARNGEPSGTRSVTTPSGVAPTSSFSRSTTESHAISSRQCMFSFP
eukprot:7966629-Prorocentrum_lima.AAC.1